jgi:FAD/FMN-containing dehydrogenase
MIANNACGAHSVAWGTTADNLAALEVLLADGTRMDLNTPGGTRDAEARRHGSSRPQRAGRGRSTAGCRRSQPGTRC